MADRRERFARQPAEGGREVVEKELERKQEPRPADAKKEESQPGGDKDDR